MKNLILLLLVCICLSGSAAAQELTQAERDVKKLERDWLDAYEKHDPVAMKRILADGFLITFADGSSQTKDEVVKSVTSPRPPGSMKFFTENVSSRVYGDTVILTGTVISEWERDGKKQSDRSIYTDTYVKYKGRWQVVASHLGRAPSK
jgi:ketosteroid isomerase-like protein